MCEQIVDEKDKEIEELKKLIMKLQGPNPNHRESCITELTRIMEDILMMYPDCLINPVQTIEELYKYRMRQMMGPTTLIHEIINKIEMFNHPRSFYMLKNFQVQLESLSWEEEILPVQPSLIHPTSRVIAVYSNENLSFPMLFVEFINNFIIGEAVVGIAIYSKKDEVHDERFNMSPVSNLKIKCANRATKVLLDHINALIKDIKQTIFVCQNCSGDHLPKDCPISMPI
jgi:hypothetical protein